MNFLNNVAGPLLFPSILWRGTGAAVHLTFDDGPHPVATPNVLDILHERGIRATFFIVGRQAHLHPEIVRRIVQEGHSIGNHSQSHRTLMFKPSGFQQNEIRGANSVIRDVSQQTPRLFRPPYGYFDFRTLRIAKAEELKLVMWNVDTRDFAKPFPDAIIRRVGRSLKEGSIVLLHDNDSTAHHIHKYLEPLIDELIGRGLQPSAILP
jgi:peptidoglycan/xylan/chitin deacetylase (PgdA/CDA1 family)